MKQLRVAHVSMKDGTGADKPSTALRFTSTQSCPATMSVFDRLRLPARDRDLGWTRYVWLVYLLAFYVEPLLQPTPPGRWIAYLAAGAVLVLTYFRGQWLRNSALIPIVLIQLMLGVGFSSMNVGAYVFFIYAAASAARMEETMHAVAWIAGITATGLLTAYMTDAPFYCWLAHGAFTPLIGSLNVHQTSGRRATERLRVAHDEIERIAAVAERERIARDLHDVLGHTLSLIVLKAELASKVAETNPARAIQEIRDVESVSRAALKEVREAIHGYRPTLIDEISRARQLLAAANIRTVVDVALDSLDLSVCHGAEERMALALREAVTNVVRHAGASTATIRAWVDDANGDAVLEIADDGRGIKRPEGRGLRGMRDRVEAVDGRVTLSSVNGTRLTIAIPLAHRRAARQEMLA